MRFINLPVTVLIAILATGCLEKGGGGKAPASSSTSSGGASSSSSSPNAPAAPVGNTAPATAKPVAVSPAPTAAPTPVATAKPTAAPTAVPTPVATAKPTAAPTPVPTPVPTATPSPEQIVGDFAAAIGGASCGSTECIAAALTAPLPVDASIFSDNAPIMSGVTYVAKRDSVIIRVPVVAGAKDYRVFGLPSGAVVSYDGSKRETVRGTTIFCAGQKQIGAPKLRTQIVMKEILVEGLMNSSAQLVVEATDRLCPFVGSIGQKHESIKVSINEVPVADRVTFSMYTEAEVREKYGSLFVNGQGKASVLAQQADPNPPVVLARAVVDVKLLDRNVMPMANFDDFTDESDQPVLVRRVKGSDRSYSLDAALGLNGDFNNSGRLLQNKKWNFYQYGFEYADVFMKRGQLMMNLADYGQDVFSSNFMTPKKPVALSNASYVHTTFEVPTNASGRRYWWWTMCGASQAGRTFKADGSLAGEIVQTPFFYQNDGRNPSVAGWNCVQLFQRDGYAFEVDDKKPQSDIMVILNRSVEGVSDPNNDRDNVVSVNPDQYYSDIYGGNYGWHPGIKSWFRKRDANGAFTGPMLDELLTVHQPVKFDVYVKRDRLVLYVNGKQTLCNNFGAGNNLTMAEGAIALGQVLYHSAAERMEFQVDYWDRTGQRHYLENQPYVDTRNWDNIGYRESANLPADFDSSVCFTPGQQIK